MPVITGMRIATNECFEVEDSANCLTPDDLLNRQVVRIPAAALIDSQCSLIRVGKLNHLVGLSSRQTKRFFRDHVLARTQHLHRDIGVGIGGGRDYHDIYAWILRDLRKFSAGPHTRKSLAVACSTFLIAIPGKRI